MVKMWSWLTAAALVLAIAAPAAAQGEQARVAGTVRDQSGAFFGGAKVIARNERTGEERSAESNEKGYYLVAGLKPAQYTLRAEKAGFAPIEYTGMPLGGRAGAGRSTSSSSRRACTRR